MTAFLKKHFFNCLMVLFTVCMAGCTSEPEIKAAPDYLLKTSAITISSEDFSDELDLKRAAYPYNIDDNPAEYDEMVINLVEILSEEIVLLSAAAEKGIIVTDQEATAAEDEFKKDYPEDSFDKMLLTNAVSYSFWKKRFKRDLIMEKLIEQDLEKKIEISSQDIVDFYKQHKTDGSPLAEKGTQETDGEIQGSKTINNEEELISRLRREKTQESYAEWMQKLSGKYPVDINKEKLKTFLSNATKNEGKDNEN